MKISLLVLLILINIIISDADVDCHDDIGYLNGLSGEAYKQYCYSLSFIDGNKKCCYQSEKCLSKDKDSTDFGCPTYSTIYNNCGMAGFLEPLNSDICTEISLVQGYCCYVETDKGKACIRTKKLEKDVNVTTEQIDKHVKAINKEAIITKVICKGWNLQINILLFVLISYFIIF